MPEGPSEDIVVDLTSIRDRRRMAADARIANTLATYNTLSKSGQPLWLTTANDKGVSAVHGRVIKVTERGVVTVMTSKGEEQVDLSIYPQASFHAGSTVPKTGQA